MQMSLGLIASMSLSHNDIFLRCYILMYENFHANSFIGMLGQSWETYVCYLLKSFFSIHGILLVDSSRLVPRWTCRNLRPVSGVMILWHQRGRIDANGRATGNYDQEEYAAIMTATSIVHPASQLLFIMILLICCFNNFI